MKKTTLLISLILIGCSTPPQLAKSQNISQGTLTRVTADERAQLVKMRQERDQDSRDRKLVMAKKEQGGLTSSPSSIDSAAAFKPGALLSMKPGSAIAANFEKMPEGPLFAEIRDRYQAHDLWGFELRAKAYLGKYTNSDRRDEIIYMKGLLGIEEKDYGSALIQFNRILRDHPNGKKAPSAMFAKGVLYKKMNLTRESKLALTEVLHRYPGSPESIRAKVELKVIK